MNERERLAGLLAAAREDRERLRAELDAKEAERLELARELEATKRWLHHIESARTWRMTAPVRRFASLFRRPPGRRDGSQLPSA